MNTRFKLILAIGLAVISFPDLAMAEPKPDAAIEINAALCKEIKPAIDRHLAALDQTLAADGLADAWKQYKAPAIKAEAVVDHFCATYLGAIAEALEDAALMHAMAQRGK